MKNGIFEQKVNIIERKFQNILNKILDNSKDKFDMGSIVKEIREVNDNSSDLLEYFSDFSPIEILTASSILSFSQYRFNNLKIRYFAPKILIYSALKGIKNEIDSIDSINTELCIKIINIIAQIYDLVRIQEDLNLVNSYYPEYSLQMNLLLRRANPFQRKDLSINQKKFGTLINQKIISELEKIREFSLENKISELLGPPLPVLDFLIKMMSNYQSQPPFLIIDFKDPLANIVIISNKSFDNGVEIENFSSLIDDSSNQILLK